MEKYSLSELKKIAIKMGLHPRRSKTEMLTDISQAFREYEEYKQKKIDKYTRGEQLGQKGKEGTTFLVTDRKGREFAMKTFRKAKSSSNLKKEYDLQKKAAKKGVSPKVYDYDTVSKYIVMEKMDEHFFQLVSRQNGIVYKYQQKRILEILRKLDETGVFHNDANVLNLMLKNGEIYLIDFGLAKEITPKLIKLLKTKHPNFTLMLIGLILKFKELKLPEKSYRYLLKHVSLENMAKYGLN